MNQKIETKEEDLDIFQNIQELKPLKDAIFPRKLTKDFKALVFNANSNKGTLKLSLLEDHQRQSKFAEHSKKSTVIPLLLDLLFTQNNTRATFINRENSNQKQQEPKKKSNETQRLNNQTPQDFRDEFLKDKKNKPLLALIKSRIQAAALQKKRDKDQYSKQGVDFCIEKLSFTIDDLGQQSLSSLLDLLATFFCVLSSLVQSSSIKIQTLEITLNAKNYTNVQFSQESFVNFSSHFWKFFLQVRKFETILIKLPKIKQFFNPLHSLILKHAAQQKDEIYGTLFQVIYRLQIEQIQIDQNEKQVDLSYLGSFLKNAPNLKVLAYKVNFMENNNDNNNCLTYNNSFKFFKTISESNFLIENLAFCKVKLSYDSSQNQQQIESKSLQEDEPNEKAQTMDRNLYWMKKMQENCPFLIGVRVEFQKKSQAEERRLSQKFRIQYIESLKTTRELMNLFHKRSMNAQTYFNCIKIMETQGFDYETILGVLDKISPFAPK